MGMQRVAVVGGDGIGPEVTEAGCPLLESPAGGELSFEFRRLDWGSGHDRRTSPMMAEDGLAQLAGFDAISCGAVGDPNLPDDVALWGPRLAICQGFDQSATVRHAQLPPGGAEVAARLRSAIETVTARREAAPADPGGKATTRQMTDAVIAAIRGANLEMPLVDS